MRNAAVAAPAAPSSERLRVAIAEDNALLRVALCELLEELGVEVAFTAADGRELLEALEDRPVEAILADLRMPHLTGYGVLEAIDERGLQLPVIALSASGETIRDAALRRGACAYLVKPVAIDELEAALRALGAAIAWRRKPGACRSALVQALEEAVAAHGFDAAGVTMLVEERPVTVAATGMLTVRLDVDQYLLGEGPCLAGVRSGRRQVCAADGGSWPGFARRAGLRGMRLTVSEPLCAGAVMNLYRRAAATAAEPPLRGSAELVASALRDHAP